MALVLLAVPATASAKDRDHDRLPDRWEKRHGFSTSKKSTRGDRDQDGLRNLGEYRSRTNPRIPDTDHDGIGDADEDRDRDHVDNANEMDEGTNPRDHDSDDDRRPDGREDADHDALNNSGEDASGNEPDDPDTDDDGTRDGAERAGRIASFEAGMLTIDLGTNRSVSGRVTADTEVECKTEDEHEDEDESIDEDAEAVASHDDDEGSEGRGEDADDEEGDVEDAEGDDGCSTSDLKPGVLVHEAEMTLGPDGLVVEEIEIIR